MSKNYKDKYMSAIRHETLTNQGKVDNLESLWSHYSELLDKFMREINYNLVKGNGVKNKSQSLSRRYSSSFK